MRGKLFILLLAVMILLGFSILDGGLLQEKEISPPEATGEILIKFKAEVSNAEIDSMAKKIGLEKVKDFPGIGVGLYKIISKVTVEEALQKCKDSSVIEYAEPNYRYRIDKSASETRRGEEATTLPPPQSSGSEKIGAKKNTSKVSKKSTPQEIEQSQYLSGQVLIKYKKGTSNAAIDNHRSQQELVVLREFAEIGAQLCQLPTEVAVMDAVQKYSQSPIVEYAEPNYIYHMDEVPNDPRFRKLWGLHNTGQTGGRRDADIDAPEAWDIQKGSADALIAVIDTGVDYNHEDLKPNMWKNLGESGDGRETNGIDDDGNGFVDDFRGWDFVGKDNNPFDDNGHGTHVAGTIGAVGDNGVGVVGVNWQVGIMPLKFLNASGSGFLSDAIDAILYAANMGAQILSNSWGGTQFSQALRDVISYADGAGALFVAAAGNDKEDNDFRPHYPSSYDLPNIIAVAASDDRDELAEFTNWGKKSVDLAAPGVDILSTTPKNKYEWFSGTSMATPHVSGVAGLVLAQFPSLPKEKVKIRILGAVDPFSRFYDYLASGGRLNAAKALSTSPIIAYTTELPNTKDTQGPYVVTSTIIDDMSVLSARLLYTTSGASTSTDTVEMVDIGEDRYKGAIPGQPLDTMVSYFVLAKDGDGNTTRGRIFSFKVSEAAACCGALAITIRAKDPIVKPVVEIAANFSLILIPIVILKLRRKRKVS